MSRIDELTAELCPGGVGVYLLGDVAGYSTSRLAASEVDGETFVGVDNLLPDKKGKTTSTYVPEHGSLHRFEPNDVLIGNIRPYLKKVWLATTYGGCSGDVLAIHLREDFRSQILPKFLYYQLSSDRFFAFSMKHARGAKMPRGDKSAILNFPITLPPVPVQAEIVDALDKFTELEAELNAELDARLAQYEYYLNEILGSVNDSPLVPLGNVGSFSLGHSLTRKDLVAEGVGCIHYGEIYTAFGPSTEQTISFVAEDRASQFRPAAVGDLVVAMKGETADDVAKAVAWVGSRPIVIGDNASVFSHSLDPTYLSYVFRSKAFARQKRRFVKGTNVKVVLARDLARIEIPVPTDREQQRIAFALDKFHALTTDVTSGIPAEITARRKQYEYYRNKLLTFPEATA